MLNKNFKIYKIEDRDKAYKKKAYIEKHYGYSPKVLSMNTKTGKYYIVVKPCGYKKVR